MLFPSVGLKQVVHEVGTEDEKLFTMRPSTMPKLSLMTLARGARQLVVHEALLWRRDGENTSHIQTVQSYWHQKCTDTRDIWRDDLGFDIRFFFFPPFWQGTLKSLQMFTSVLARFETQFTGNRTTRWRHHGSTHTPHFSLWFCPTLKVIIINYGACY